MVYTRKRSDFTKVTTEDNGNILGWFRLPDASGECVDWDFIEFTRDERDALDD